MPSGQTNANLGNLLEIPLEPNLVKNYEFPKVYCTNARSLTNKMDEISIELKDNDIDIAIVTETWLNSEMPAEAVSIEGYTVIRNDRQRKKEVAYVYI